MRERSSGRPQEERSLPDVGYGLGATENLSSLFWEFFQNLASPGTGEHAETAATGSADGSAQSPGLSRRDLNEGVAGRPAKRTPGGDRVESPTPLPPFHVSCTVRHDRAVPSDASGSRPGLRPS
jgi:hypothetical protein